MIPLAIAVSFLYASLAEYWLHRYAMHKSIFGRGWWWHNHVYSHHHINHPEVGMNMPTNVVMFVSLPLLLFAFWSLWFAAAWVLFCWFYAVSWTAIHRAHHEAGAHWAKRIPGYQALRDHHLGHHARPSTNFGTIFIWTDYVFRTKLK